MRRRGRRDEFRTIANGAAYRLGTPQAFAFAIGTVGLWLIAGPFVGFSSGWQLVINTITSVLTFIMVFLLQATQNRDAMAIHLKLDELIRTSSARNRFAGLEGAPEEELLRLEAEFRMWREKMLSSMDELPLGDGPGGLSRSSIEPLAREPLARGDGGAPDITAAPDPTP